MLTDHHLIIRADATSQIGTGHIMRCIALAQAWQDRGGHVTFLSHCKNDKLRHRIIHEGSHFEPIHKPYPDPLDLDQTIQKLSSIKKDRSSDVWLVLDGYHFNPDYQKYIIESGHKLLVIDDNNHHPHYHAHILLNQNIHAPELKYSCNIDTVQLLGTKFVLLRKEFLKYKNWKRKISYKANKILVTMGGADPDNVTLKVIKALNMIADPDFEIKIIVGPANMNIESLQKELSLSLFTYSLLSNAENMSSLMAWSDLAVSAGGITCWELLFMGLPIVILITAENQKRVAEELHTLGVAMNLGSRNIRTSDFVHALSSIITDSKSRSSISENSRKLIGGVGADKVVSEMIRLFRPSWLLWWFQIA